VYRERPGNAKRVRAPEGQFPIRRPRYGPGLLLSAAGGLLGLGLAFMAIRSALHLLPDSLPRIDSISLDGTVAGFAVLVALASGALSGLAPAFAAVRTNLLQSLKEGAQTGTGAASHSWLRSSLVVSEIGIALVLLTSFGRVSAQL
jgi:hypothetical protein